MKIKWFEKHEHLVGFPLVLYIAKSSMYAQVAPIYLDQQKGPEQPHIIATICSTSTHTHTHTELHTQRALASSIVVLTLLS